MNYDWRPAVLVGDKAFVVFRPGADWVEWDRFDIGQTGAVMSEKHWRRYFWRQGYRALDVWRFRNFAQDNEIQDRPPPTARDFDDAARAVWRAHLAHQAAASLPILPDDETPPTAPP